MVGLGDEDFDPTGTEQNPLSAADRQIMNQLEAIDGLTGLNCSQEMALWDTRATLLPAILNFLDQEEWSETALAAIRAYMNQTPNPDLDSFEDFLDFYRMVTEELGPALELSVEEMVFLIGRHDLAVSIFDHVLNENYANEELRYCVWASMNFGNDLEYYTSKFDEFDPEKDEPFEYQDDSGIKIQERYVPYGAPENFPYFGETPYRPDHEYDPPSVIPEDMQFGYDGDVNLLSYWEGFWSSNVYHEPSGNRLLDSKSDDELFDILESRLQSDVLNLNLKNVAAAYLNRFRNRTGGDYFNEELSQYTLTNPHMEATVKDFGKWLNEKLTEVDGDIAAIDESKIKDTEDGFTDLYRAIFNTGEMRTGLKILINDTEKLTVYLMNDFTYDTNTNEWSGTFYFVVHDNFGLDNQDLIDFQGKFFAGKGFAAWWILQHRRGYRPFRTEIRNAFKLSGDLDN